MKAWVAAALLSLPAAAQGQVPEATPAERAAAEQRLAGWTRAALAPFGGEREVRRHFADARAAEVAQPRPEEQVITIMEDRMGPRGVAGPHRRYPDVDDGDVIVRVGRFLIVVDNSLVFSIDTGADGRAPRLAGRLDLFNRALRTYFFDEAMVSGERILLSGYSRATRSVQIVVLRLAQDGALRREDDFLISSQDDFQTSVAGDRLIIYTSTVGPVDYSPPDFPWPTIRRGRAQRALLSARSIYRPLIASLRPELHIVTICPLGGEEAGEPECRATAFAGPSGGYVHFGPTDAFVALRPHYDDPGLPPRPRPACHGDLPVWGDVGRTILYRVPLAGGPPSILSVRGELPGGGALQAAGGELRALLRWKSERCDGADALVYLRAPLASFGDAPAEPATSAYAPILGGHLSEPYYRFTDTDLAYGERADWSEPTLFVLPVERPQAAREVAQSRSIDRIEPSGRAFLLAGRDGQGGDSGAQPLGDLALSRLDPESGRTASAPLAGTGEGRLAGWPASRSAADGSELIGVPVLFRGGEGGQRLETRFFTLAPDGALAGAGTLVSRILPEYHCPDDCTHWFTVSRPIFIGERIFAYSGAALIEARLEGGRVREIGRLDIVQALRR